MCCCLCTTTIVRWSHRITYIARVVDIRTLANLLLFLQRQAEELLRVPHDPFLQFGWHPVPRDLEETVIQAALSDIRDELRFGSCIVAVEHCVLTISVSSWNFPSYSI